MFDEQLVVHKRDERKFGISKAFPLWMLFEMDPAYLHSQLKQMAQSLGGIAFTDPRMISYGQPEAMIEFRFLAKGTRETERE